MMIDTHCHLCDEAFANDVDEVIIRAVANGVRGLLVLTEERSETGAALELKNRFPDVVNIALGLHPVQKFRDSNNDPRSVSLKDMEGMRQIILKHSNQLTAIGEVGLDFTADLCSSHEYQDIQRVVFTEHIRLARKLNLPLNVHSRSSSVPTLDLLKSEGANRVQMHAFDGRPSQAMIGVAAGFYFSIPPCVVRSKQKQELVKAVPLTHLLLESDAPSLGVLPQQRNEPAEITKACEFIAKTKDVDVKLVQEMTTENALKLYPNLKMKSYT